MDETKKRRVTLDLSASFFSRLEQLQELVEADSKASVLRAAFQVYEHLAQKHQAGWKLVATSPDGRSQQLVILGPGTTPTPPGDTQPMASTARITVNKKERFIGRPSLPGRGGFLSRAEAELVSLLRVDPLELPGPDEIVPSSIFIDLSNSGVTITVKGVSQRVEPVTTYTVVYPRDSSVPPSVTSKFFRRGS